MKSNVKSWANYKPPLKDAGVLHTLLSADIMLSLIAPPMNHWALSRTLCVLHSEGAFNPRLVPLRSLQNRPYILAQLFV